MPLLAMGGEGSSGPVIDRIWAPVATRLTAFVIPEAGHWIGDENPVPVARRIVSFLNEDP